MGNLTNMLITMTIVSAIVLGFNYILGIQTIGDSTINLFTGYGSGTVALNSDITAGFDTEVSQAEAGNFLYYAGIIDGLKKIFSFVINLLTLGFSLFNLLYQTGAPLILCNIIGLPFALAYYLSIVGIVRGMDI